LVVGKKVVAAMQRDATPGDFRANLHRGGTAVAAVLSTEEKRIAVRAAGALGLGIAGVDLLRSRRGPLLLEVNASPGLEGIEAATGVDVAGAVVELLEAQAREVPAETRPHRKPARA
jgi:ribosomal protein S6--L-glutamate ligase